MISVQNRKEQIYLSFVCSITQTNVKKEKNFLPFKPIVHPSFYFKKLFFDSFRDEKSILKLLEKNNRY